MDPLIWRVWKTTAGSVVLVRDHDRAKIGLEIAIAIAISGTALAGDVGER